MNRNFDNISRRALLAGGLGLGAVSLLPRAGMARAAAPPAEVDVLIIGAGAAGIGAAWTLRDAGLHNFAILESTARIGGRAYTDVSTFGAPFDIGCAWIHGADNPGNQYAVWAQQWSMNPKADIHDCKGLDLDRLYFESGPKGARHAERQSDAVVAEFGETHETIDELIIKARPDIAASRAVSIGTPVEKAAATYIGPMDAGVDFKDLSSYEIRNMGDYHPNWLLREGYGALVAQSASVVPPLFKGDQAYPLSRKVYPNTRVFSIAMDRGGRVRVRYGSPDNTGEIFAKAVIVTTSMGVLRAGKIDMPDLPQTHRDAIQQLPMGLLTKIPLYARGLDAKLKGLGVEAFSSVLDQSLDNAQSMWFLNTPFETDMTVGFVGGDLARDLCKDCGDPVKGAQARAEVIDFAKARVKAVYGADIARMLNREDLGAKSLITPWSWDQNSLGAYSAAQPGHFCDRVTLQQPVEGRIFFAGEALAVGEQYAGQTKAGCDALNAGDTLKPESFVATAHGAFATGVGSAKKVLGVVARAPAFVGAGG